MTTPMRAVVGALILAAGAQAGHAQAMTKLDLCAMVLTFSDDFDTMSIASRWLGDARWIAHTPWNGDFGDAAFTDPGPTGPFSVADGVLRITASRRPNGKWTSGLIAAADAAGHGSGVQYGYFEARMKLPLGPGIWAAFWVAALKPSSDRSPGVEIDVNEFYGHMPDRYSSAVHVWYQGVDKARSRHTLNWTNVPVNTLTDAFHTYGLRVSPQTTTVYFDRNPVWETQTPEELKTPLFPLVNLALGSGFPIDRTPDPSTLLVDYVHVYRLDAGARSGGCPPP